MPVDDAANGDIPDKLLQSALEFAVGIAAAGTRLRPPMASPATLKPFLRFQKLPPKALGPVRKAVEADDDFRTRLGSVATPELLDEAGMLWLARPEGWEQQLAALAAAPVEPVLDAAGELRREVRRREAAEAAAARARVEAAGLEEELQRERSARGDDRVLLERAAADLSGAARQLAEAQASIRRLQAEVQRAEARAEKAEAAAAAAEHSAGAAAVARDTALAARSTAADRATPADSIDREALRRLLLQATALLDGASARGAVAPSAAQAAPAGTPSRRGRARPKRTPLAIPGGLYGKSEAAAEHLLRSPGAQVLIDGYNVAKLGWPALDLAHQRDACIAAAEDIAKRWGTAITIVFDGADIVGSRSPRRRVVRVMYSPAGVLADDVLRTEVAELDPGTPVIVVTNDQAVVTDVRALGANTVASDQFLALARR